VNHRFASNFASVSIWLPSQWFALYTPHPGNGDGPGEGVGGDGGPGVGGGVGPLRLSKHHGMLSGFGLTASQQQPFATHPFSSTPEKAQSCRSDFATLHVSSAADVAIAAAKEIKTSICNAQTPRV
jgi:hypothetical protein